MAYTTDVYDILADPWKNALRAALKTVGVSRESDVEFTKAVEAILGWDGMFTRDSTVAPLIKFWRMKCDKAIPVTDIANLKPLGEEDQAKLLDLLAGALAEIKATYGERQVIWGDINRIGRGGKYFPCPGAELGGWSQKTMTETVFDVGVREEPKDSGKYVAFAGSSAILLSFLYPEGIESYSIFNWGQSADPASPHYVDQAEALYAERKFKPTWFKKEDLLRHVESKRTLTFP